MDIERYLPMVEKAAAKGTIEMADDASAFDRMRMHDKLPQHYGSQTFAADPNGRGGALRLWPVEDAARRGSLRAAAGLTPIAEYLEAVEAACGRPVLWDRTKTAAETAETRGWQASMQEDFPVFRPVKAMTAFGRGGVLRIFGGMSREADSVGTRGIRDGEDVGRFGVSRFAAVVPINVRSRKRAGVRFLMALYSWRPGRQGCFFASMDFSFLVPRSERHGSAVGNDCGVFPAGTRRRDEEFYLCRGACSAIRSDPAVEPCAADETVRCREGFSGRRMTEARFG